MKPFSLSIAALLFCLSFTACQKKDDLIPAPDKLVVVVSSPAEAQIFHSGEKVPFQATVTYPSELHGYEVAIQDAATGESLFFLDAHVHSDHFVIDTAWTPAVTKTTNFTAILKTAIDHDGQESTKEVHFSVQP